MPLTFFEFAQLALLASIAFLLMHEIVHRDALSPYWPTVIVLPLFVAIPIAVILGFAWLVFAGLNWLFDALLGFAWLVPAGLNRLFSAL